MAELCVLNVSASGSGQGGTYSTSGKVFVSYSITNYDDKVVIQSNIAGTITNSGNARFGTLKSVYSGTPSTWTIGSTKYSITASKYIYANGQGATGTDVIGTTSNLTINKTHSTQTINVTAYYHYINVDVTNIYGNSSDKVYSAKTVTGTISVGPKSSYTVSYNANGGSGAPAAQTKWYGETLKLQTGTPTRTGWTFKGWATSSTATSATYSAGANYTANSGATLYAVWERNTYTVSYNANGGTGAPANQTKQYDIALTLSSAAPTFSGWTFKGWATSTANASAGTVNYAKGATYTGNTALTLYAVWELTYRKPTLANVKIDRCLQSGDLDDDGDCALVTADWTVFRSSLPRYYGGNTYPYANNSISQDGYVVTAGTYTETRTPTGESDDGYSVVVGSGFDSDTSYAVTISITDTQEIVSDHTVTATGTLPAQFFPMDYNADATAVGFFMPAPNSGNGDGAYFGKDIHVYIDTATASGSDAVINQALSDLGWTDVLE